MFVYSLLEFSDEIIGLRDRPKLFTAVYLLLNCHSLPSLHDGRVFSAWGCFIALYRPEHLLMHKKTVHGQQHVSFEFPVCGKAFSSWDKTLRHRTIHTGPSCASSAPPPISPFLSLRPPPLQHPTPPPQLWNLVEAVADSTKMHIATTSTQTPTPTSSAAASTQTAEITLAKRREPPLVGRFTFSSNNFVVYKMLVSFTASV